MKDKHGSVGLSDWDVRANSARTYETCGCLEINVMYV